ncbi:unnamed protein product, partial [marine sediment metagenome]
SKKGHSPKLADWLLPVDSEPVERQSPEEMKAVLLKTTKQTK